MTSYRGRFAPSPTGPLHFGSLVAAMASYLEARSHSGEWLIRIDDVDEGRRIPESESWILKTLERFGFEWDGPISRQTSNKEQYRHQLAQLIDLNLAYSCECSRKQVTANAFKTGKEGPIYPGTCKTKDLAFISTRAIRVKTNNQIIDFEDKLFGQTNQNLAEELGDFVIRRADGLFAYQLAVVVDDHISEISHVVRGADLLWSTPRQIHLQQLLGFDTPSYSHIPLVYGEDGRKLSKSDKAHPLENDDPIPALHMAWKHLNQPIEPNMPNSTQDFWPWALEYWQPERLKQHEQ